MQAERAATARTVGDDERRRPRVASPASSRAARRRSWPAPRGRAASGRQAFFIIKEEFKLEPLSTVNKFMIYYVLADMMFRYFFQKIPTLTIRPLLVLPIKKDTIVHFSLGKTVLTYFNITHAFFFIPFSIVLLVNGYNALGVITWHLGILAIILFINFLNILINNKDIIFGIAATIVVGLIASQYYKLFDITLYTQPFFQGLYEHIWMVLIPIFVLILTYYFTFNFFKKDLTLDERLHIKKRFSHFRKLNLVKSVWNFRNVLKKRYQIITKKQTRQDNFIHEFLFLVLWITFFHARHL